MNSEIPVASMFPSKELLLAACRGFPFLRSDPILDAAAELTVLHQSRECTQASALGEIDWRRTQLVQTIDWWATITAPVRCEASRHHRETVGQIVDRLAHLTAQAAAMEYAPDSLYYDACVLRDDLANTYQDLVEDIYSIASGSGSDVVEGVSR